MKKAEKSSEILVVDDSEDMRELIMEMVRDAGYFVIGAESAEMAIETMRFLRFDAVVSDVELPGKNGLELAQIIAKESPQTKIILISGSMIPAIADKAYAMGIECIVKPFAMSILLQKLERLIGK